MTTVVDHNMFLNPVIQAKWGLQKRIKNGITTIPPKAQRVMSIIYIDGHQIAIHKYKEKH